MFFQLLIFVMTEISRFDEIPTSVLQVAANTLQGTCKENFLFGRKSFIF